MKNFLSLLFLLFSAIVYGQANLSVEYLVVAGGGGGAAGGGGGGGVISGSGYVVSKNTPLTVTVGKGGTSGSGQVLGTRGDNSVFGIYTAIGGGAGGSKSGLLPTSGGSGGGGGWDQPAITAAAGTAGQGYAGGLSNRAGYGASGGGGGAGAAGSNATIISTTSGRGGNGGNGISSSISGTATYYGGGGGGGINDNSGTLVSNGGGTGGLGGGGNGSAFGVITSGANFTGSAGTANTGGGGGGTDCESTVAGAGGSGIVIIRYAGAPVATGGTITQAGGYTIHTFTTIGSFTFTYTGSSDASLSALTTSSGALYPTFVSATTSYMLQVPAATTSITVIPTATQAYSTITVNGNTVTNGNASAAVALSLGTNTINVIVTAPDGTTTKTYTLSVTRGFAVEYLVVAGGGGGASGGGGGGGVLTATNYVMSTGQTLTVTVGGGGAAGSGTIAASNGSNSRFGSFIAIGGGAGGAISPVLPTSGGSGGGGGWDQPTISRAAGTAGQGNAGGLSNRAGFGGGGGGGGANTAGSDATSITATSGRGGNGGDGKASSISGTTTYYGGGGGGGINDNSGTLISNGGGTGGLGGGGNGSSYGVLISGSNFTGTAGTPNTGGGGGGTDCESSVAGAGGSGIVIIKYPGAPVATGGTVTQSGGYTIHTYSTVGTFSFIYDIANANLSSLATSTGTLSPSFNADSLSYTVSVPNATTSITVTPTKADAFASIQVNGTAVNSGSASSAIALNIGNNTINVLVTAQNGTSKTYTITVTRICNPPAAPSANGTSICAGLSTALSATCTGTPGWYSAATGGTYLGSTNFTTPVLTSTTTYYVQDSTCGASARTAVTVTVINNWFGGIGNWSTGSNWCGSNVPSANSNTTVNAGKLVLDADLVLTGKLTITGTGTLVIKAGKTLTVSAGGVVDFGDRPVLFESNASGTAAMGKVTGTVLGATNVTVERYIPQNTNRSWRLLAAPASGQTIHEAWQENQQAGVNALPGYGTNITSSSSAWSANGFDYSTPGNSLLVYDAASDNLVPISSTSLPITSEQGYFIYIRGDRAVTPSSSITGSSATVLRTKGMINFGNQQSVNVMANKFALVGNPYPSAIDLRNVSLGGGCVGTSFYVWDPKLLGSYQIGAFQTLTLSGGNYIVVPGGGSYGAYGSVCNTIQSGAAFFVQASSTAGTVTIDENSKASGSAMVFRPVDNSGEKNLAVTLYAITNNSKEIADGTMIIFDENYKDGLDNEDSRKFTNFGENFGIKKDTQLLVIERRNLPTVKDSVQFEVTDLKKINYQLKIVTSKLLSTGLTAVLQDSYLHQATELKMEDSTFYSFTVNADPASSNKNRFKIILKPAIVLPVTIQGIKALREGAVVAVQWQAAEQADIRDYQIEKSADGRKFFTAGTMAPDKTTTSATYKWLDSAAGINTNFYRIKIIDINGNSHYSKVVQVAAIALQDEIMVSPNPVEGRVLHLHFNNQASDQYLLKVFTNDGRQLIRRAINHNGGSASYAINLPATVAKGSYRIQITRSKGENVNQQIIIK